MTPRRFFPFLDSDDENSAYGRLRKMRGTGPFYNRHVETLQKFDRGFDLPRLKELLGAEFVKEHSRSLPPSGRIDLREVELVDAWHEGDSEFATILIKAYRTEASGDDGDRTKFQETWTFVRDLKARSFESTWKRVPGKERAPAEAGARPIKKV